MLAAFPHPSAVHQAGPRGDLVQHPCCNTGSHLVPGLWRDGGLGARHRLVAAGTGHVGTAAPAPAEAGLSVMLDPAAGGTGATFIYYYQAGKEERGERGAET